MSYGVWNRTGEISCQTTAMVQTRYEGGLDTNSDNGDEEAWMALRYILAVAPSGPTDRLDGVLEGEKGAKEDPQISSELCGPLSPASLSGMPLRCS